jgi:spore maturation protein CgeB
MTKAWGAYDQFLQKPLRILAVSDTWQGSNAYAYVRAFRRLGHSVRVVPSENYVPGEWKRKPLRVLRRIMEPVFMREYTEALIEEAKELRPHLFFVFKGRYVAAEAIKSIRELGAIAINFYPDVSFMAHGKYIPGALPVYDWIFTTKTFGVTDLERLLGVRTASFLPHSYDPEAHFPIELDGEDKAVYDCDTSFVGTWSPKKQKLIEQISRALPSMHLRIWGAQWESAQPSLGSRIEGRGVFGMEYSKALIASKINLCILSEARRGASSGDLITSRTFHIPATGAFMLHERSTELLNYFEEGTECACFETGEELIEKIAYYLERPEERQEIAAAGRRRVLDSGYSVDCRAMVILEKVAEMRAVRTEPIRV